MAENSPLSIFLLQREVETLSCDEVAGYVVVAHDEREARKFAFLYNEQNDRLPIIRYRDEDPIIWLTSASCRVIGIASAGVSSGVILEDHIGG